MIDTLREPVNSSEFFKLYNGLELKTIQDLLNYLADIDEESFAHHVNSEGNHFADWVEHVFDEVELAKVMRRYKSSASLKKNMDKFIEKKNTPKKVRSLLPRRKKAKSETNISFSSSEEPEKSSDDVDKEILGKVNEILSKEKEILDKEREISFREEKIREVEDRIEANLASQKSGQAVDPAFFSREFMQGIVAGFLITLIGVLIYLKFLAA